MGICIPPDTSRLHPAQVRKQDQEQWDMLNFSQQHQSAGTTTIDPALLFAKPSICGDCNNRTSFTLRENINLRGLQQFHQNGWEVPKGSPLEACITKRASGISIDVFVAQQGLNDAAVAFTTGTEEGSMALVIHNIGIESVVLQQLGNNCLIPIIPCPQEGRCVKIVCSIDIHSLVRQKRDDDA